MIEGYKDSPLGKIPIDWELGLLGEYLDYVQPTKYITNNISDEGNTPVLTANKAFVLGYTNEEEGVFSNFPVIIFDDFTTNSKFVDFPFKVRSSALKILVPKSKNINIIYLYESLKSINYQCIEHKRYWISEYQHLKIPIPPLSEQQKIAEILSTVDAKIAIIDQQITETQELKKGLMQRLLTKGIGHTEFKDSPLGEIPVGWEVVKICEIADINKNSLPNTTSNDFEFYYIDLSAVKSGTIEFPSEKVAYSNSPSRARRILSNEDVIMATVRPNLLGIGYANFETNKFICSTGFAIISHKENSDGQYIYQNLYSENVQAQINKLIVGSNYPAINSSDVQNIKIPLPHLSEQQKIAIILSSVDEKLATLSEKKETYQELKKGLMQQLLTGLIRVKV
jgi:type I restriction enzyme S subunit